jgi:hypothetical protein
MSETISVVIDTASLKAAIGLAVMALGAFVTATATILRRTARNEEVELSVLGDPSKNRKGLQRIVLGSPEHGEPGLVPLSPHVTSLIDVPEKVDRHNQVVNGIVRGFDILDEKLVAEKIREKLSDTPPRRRVDARTER